MALPARLHRRAAAADSVDYAIRMNPWSRSPGDFILEAGSRWRRRWGRAARAGTRRESGDVYGLEIVHTDPDGGDYGGHFLIYGRGDDDSTWGRMDADRSDSAHRTKT